MTILTEEQKVLVLELNKQILDNINSNPKEFADLLTKIKTNNLLNFSGSWRVGNHKVEVDNPLITAVMMGRKDWALALLDKGADPKAKNAESKDILAVLGDHGDEELKIEMKKFLESYISPKDITEKMAAFGMAQHPRLGLESPAREFPNDLKPLVVKHLKEGRDGSQR